MKEDEEDEDEDDDVRERESVCLERESVGVFKVPPLANKRSVKVGFYVIKSEESGNSCVF